ncbi:MAG: hypothetical protein ACYC6M_09450 [Terriglobales bacterium]
MTVRRIAGGALLLFGSVWGQGVAAPAPALVDRVQIALDRLVAALQGADVSRWHGDRQARESFQSEAASIQRNLQEAVPNLLSAYRQAPDHLADGIRLFRDLDAVEQAATQATQLAAAYGPRDQADALASALDPLSQSVSDLASALEQQATQTQARLQALEKRLQVATAAAVPAPPPKAVVIDANSPASKSSRKRKKMKTVRNVVPPA